MATFVKASEIDEDTKDRIVAEVRQAITFLNPDALEEQEVERRVRSVLAHPEVDEILPAFALAPNGKPWITPVIGDVLSRVMAMDGP